MLRMVCAYLELAQERLRFDGLVSFGADEVNRRKVNKFLALVAELIAKSVLFATPG